MPRWCASRLDSQPVWRRLASSHPDCISNWMVAWPSPKLGQISSICTRFDASSTRATATSLARNDCASSSSDTSSRSANFQIASSTWCSASLCLPSACASFFQAARRSLVNSLGIVPE